MASTELPNEAQTTQTEGFTTLPLDLFRAEMRRLVGPKDYFMFEHLLTDMESRAGLLTEREQMQKCLIAISAALNPTFPSRENHRSRREG